MSKIFYSKTHEWLKVENQTAKVGISEYAAKELGDIVYINLPEVGSRVKAGETLCDLESVKAVSDISSPVTGTITSVNDDLENSPESINGDALASWICEVEIEEIPNLMNQEEYELFLKNK